MDATCPNCGSSQTKSRVVVHESGTRRSERTGSFLGASSRGSVIGGITASSGRSQSLLAKRAGPNIGTLPALLLVIAAISLIFKLYAFSAFIVLLSIPTYLATAHRISRYEAEWICNRCGQTFEPSNVPESSESRPHFGIEESAAYSENKRLPEKQCSICGELKDAAEFRYGNREGRSYCTPCSAAEKSAYASGGTEAAKAFRESKRASWRKT